METFMTTQVAHGQLLDDFIIDVSALRDDFAEYRSSFPLPPLSDSWWLPLAICNKKGE